MRLTRWKLIEIGVFFVQVDLEREGTDVSVEYDAQIPDLRTRRPRQVDVAIRYRLGGGDMLRTVEVQDRKKKIGQPMVDQFVTKAHRIGAHRTTLVSTRGFTKPAIERINEQSELLQAIRLQQLSLDAIPAWAQGLATLQLRDDVKRIALGEISLSPWSYINLDTNKPQRLLLLGDIRLPGSQAVAAVLIEPDEQDDSARIAVHVLPRSGSKQIPSSAGLSFSRSDGSTSTLIVRRRV